MSQNQGPAEMPENSPLKPGSLVAQREANPRVPMLLLGSFRTLKGVVSEVLPVQIGSPRIPIEVPRDSLAPVALEVDPWLDAACRILLMDFARPSGLGLAVAFRANAKFKPYQFRPLLKFLGVADRHLLLADETGLGKTVEAGYIITEEIARGAGERIGILCPPRLRWKWQDELWKRFGLRFEVLASARSLARALTPRSLVHRWIASSDIAREAPLQGLSARTAPLLDLLIVDEIHEFIARGGETLRRDLGTGLASVSRAIVGISATPVHLDMDDLRRVLDIVVPGKFSFEEFQLELRLASAVNSTCRTLTSAQWTPSEGRADAAYLRREIGASSWPYEGEAERLESFLSRFDSISEAATPRERQILATDGSQCAELSRHLIRTRGIEVGENRERVIETSLVRLSQESYQVVQNGKTESISETRVFSELDQLFRQAFSLVHRAQLSSSLPAISGLLSSGERGFARWEAIDEDDPESASQYGHRLSESERAEATRLAMLHSALLVDTKWDVLSALLQRLNEDALARKVVVFTHWIPTLKYLERRAKTARTFRFLVADPSSAANNLGELIQRFESHQGYCVLFSSDVLREGFDLQAADCVVNYDLPYNPQIVEQRIGRIDRVSQESNTIRVFNMVVAGSLDEVIYRKIHERVGAFERPLGAMRPISKETLEQLRRTGDITSDEVLRQASESETEKKLMEHGPFQGVESSLDEEVQRVHREQSYDPTRFLWLPFWRLFKILLPDSKVDWKPDECALEISPFPERTENLVEALAEGWETRDVLQGLRAARKAGFSARFTFPPAESPSTSALSPLAQLIARSAQSNLDAATSGVSVAVWLEVAPQANLFDAKADGVVLAELWFSGEWVRETRRVWLDVVAGNIEPSTEPRSVEPVLNLLVCRSDFVSPVSPDEVLASRIVSSCREIWAEWFAECELKEDQRTSFVNSPRLSERSESLDAGSTSQVFPSNSAERPGEAAAFVGSRRSAREEYSHHLEGSLITGGARVLLALRHLRVGENPGR